ncbi:MAG: lysylphosphatidylglycerol synthase transmembrane domain-containing protein, partial [Candidatus Hodarchaeales archaeon]
MTIRDKLPSILIYSITFFILIVLILFIQPANIIIKILEIGIWGILVIIILYALDLAVRVYRWKLLLIAQGVNLPLKVLTMPVVSALAINLFTIARAGEAVRMYTLKKNGIRYSDTISSIVIEQVLSIVGLVFVITGSLLFVGGSLQESSEIIKQLIIILILFSVVSLIGLIFLLLFPETVAKLLHFFPDFLENPLISIYNAFLSGLQDLRSKPSLLIVGILTSASIWIIEGAMLFVISQTVLTFTLVDLPWVIAASCAGNITFIIPILPGAMGEYEAIIAIVLYYSPNYPGTNATLVALIDRVAKSVLLGFFGGYATLKLGGTEILRLRKDILLDSNHGNKSGKVAKNENKGKNNQITLE